VELADNTVAVELEQDTASSYYSVYLLYWYKSTNTDAARAVELTATSSSST
jgi:hypothetical protein